MFSNPMAMMARATMANAGAELSRLTQPPQPEEPPPEPQGLFSGMPGLPFGGPLAGRQATQEPPPPADWFGRAMVLGRTAVKVAHWAAQTALHVIDQLTPPAIAALGLSDTKQPQLTMSLIGVVLAAWCLSLPFLAHSVLLSAKLVGSCVFIPPPPNFYEEPCKRKGAFL